MPGGQHTYYRVSISNYLAVYYGWTVATHTRSLWTSAYEARTLPLAVITTCSSNACNTCVCCCAHSLLYGFTTNREAPKGRHERRVHWSFLLERKHNLWLLGYGSLPAYLRYCQLLLLPYYQKPHVDMAIVSCWQRILRWGPAHHASSLLWVVAIVSLHTMKTCNAGSTTK